MSDNNIAVEQLDKPGDINHGKWYIVKGDGKDAEYLRRDQTWHKENVDREDFFWLTECAASAAARASVGLC